MSGWLWSGRGSMVRALAAKARGPGFDSRQLPGCFLFQQTVDGVMSSMVLYY